VSRQQALIPLPKAGGKKYQNKTKKVQKKKKSKSLFLDKNEFDSFF